MQSSRTSVKTLFPRVHLFILRVHRHKTSRRPSNPSAPEAAELTKHRVDLHTTSLMDDQICVRWQSGSGWAGFSEGTDGRVLLRFLLRACQASHPSRPHTDAAAVFRVRPPHRPPLTFFSLRWSLHHLPLLHISALVCFTCSASSPGCVISVLPPPLQPASL